MFIMYMELKIRVHALAILNDFDKKILYTTENWMRVYVKM